MENIKTLLDNKQYQELKQHLLSLNIADIAAFFEELEDKQQITILFRLLSKDVAADVFAFLQPEYQEVIVNALKDKEIALIMSDLYMDDAADFLQEMPANVVKRVLKNTTKENRDTLNKLLTYPEYSAGSIMTTEFIDVKQTLTVDEAFSKIKKKAADSETIGTIFVTDAKRKIEGVLSIRDLIMAERDALIKDIMNPNVIYATTTTDQEEVGALFDKYDFYALPIIDNEQRLVGIVTIDDVMDVVKEEVTEDMEKMAAISPTEEPYLKASAFSHAKKRIFWLLFLTISASVTGAIMSFFEDAFVAIPALVTFIPTLMGTGGNCGSQSATLVIRGLALNEISIKDYFKVAFKEFKVSLLVSIILSVVNFAIVWLRYGDPLLALVVALSLIIVIVIAEFIGSGLPLLAKVCKLDPAVMASPVIATLVDCIAMVSYFLIASAILGL
ncbi:MAG: magnesium transporter [Clostridia bacterium]|nr:magnesium transporter [Clostridia bacterium]